MKSASEVLHRTPWWILLASGLALAIGLAVFVTPFHLINLEKSGQTPEERQAIKREVDLTFSEGAIDIARSAVREMRKHAKDPARQEELDQALEQIDEARSTLREAGAEALRAKREAAHDISNAAKEAAHAASDAARAIAQAQRDAAKALERAGVDPTEVNKKLEEAARKAQEEAKRAETDAAAAIREPSATHESLPSPPAIPPPPPNGRRIVIRSPDNDKPLVDIDLGHGHNAAPIPPLPPLSPAERAQIREKVTGDLWRIGVGSGLILIFIPLFILTVVSKFFIDRSRASQRMAELTRKEAEYHRMGQQVTEAKLSALQAQVEPHFLYNTLASVQALTEVDPQRANEMTGHLIQYLRNALPKMRESVSTVGQEVELVRAYLNILQMRMGRRLSFDIEVAPELESAAFPPLMLPSLVENAIKHGLEPLREGGTVSIRITEVDGKLRATVADTGRGFGDVVGAGVGLANIRERLAALYGDAARLTLEASQPQGAVATLEIPRAAPSPDAMRASLGATAAAPASGREAAYAQAAPASPSRARRAFTALGTAERAWRKGLTFTFMVLVGVAAILAALGALGVLTGVFHVQLGKTMVGSAAGAFIGTAGIAVAFVIIVVALALVVAVVYGLGFFLIGVLIFVAIAILVGLFPVLAPVILLALGIAWLVRRSSSRAVTLESPDAHRNPG